VYSDSSVRGGGARSTQIITPDALTDGFLLVSTNTERYARGANPGQKRLVIDAPPRGYLGLSDPSPVAYAINLHCVLPAAD